MKVSDGSPTCAGFSEQALPRAARHKARAARGKACVISGESVERGARPCDLSETPDGCRDDGEYIPALGKPKGAARPAVLAGQAARGCRGSGERRPCEQGDARGSAERHPCPRGSGRKECLPGAAQRRWVWGA